MPLITAFGNQGQADLCEFEASLVYRARAKKDSKATEKNLSQKHKTKQKTRKKEIKSVNKQCAIT